MGAFDRHASHRRRGLLVRVRSVGPARAGRGLTVARITFVLPSYPRHPIGGFKVAYTYANALAQAGHTVTVMNMRTRPLRAASSPKRLGLRTAYRFAGHRRPRWFEFDRRVQVVNVLEPDP